MNILVISFFDDNFGDMLIRVCFDRLLRAALKNLGESGRHGITHVHIKDVTVDDVRGSSMVFFAGGAMLGMNNLSTFENIDLVTSAAEKHDIPVVFSSIGKNNFHAEDGSADKVREILSRKCVRAMAVREDPAIFTEFTAGCRFEPVQVCDPAVWASHIYREDIAEVRSSSSGRVIGINFVRGGLFKANGVEWSLSDEERFMNDVRMRLEEAGADYRFFTNGSVLDNNSLSHFADEYDIPREKVIFTDSSRELIRSVASFSAVAAVRMHAAIVSYALGVPSLNLVWNEKIPQFYAAIGRPELALEPYKVTAAEFAERAVELSEGGLIEPDRDYMLSLYIFLLNTLSELFGVRAKEPFTFEQVAEELASSPTGDSDDITDYRVKLRRARHCYRKLFDKEQALRADSKELKRSLRKAEKQSEKLRAKLNSTEAALKEKKDELKAARTEAKKLRSQLDYIYNKPLVKLYRKLKGAEKKDN